MKFKVGDEVRVRKDLEIDETYGENIFVEEMKYLWGEIVTISKVCEAGKYRLAEDETGCCWTDEMLEAVNEEVEEIDKPATVLAKVVKHWDASGVKPELEETPQAPLGFHTGEKLFFGLDDGSASTITNAVKAFLDQADFKDMPPIECRAPFKGKLLEDLKKANYYLTRAIEEMEEEE